MIKVDKIFYDEGFSMDGKGNRIMLKKNNETLIDMTFSNGKVELRGFKENQVVHSKKVFFSDIISIDIDNEEPPNPAVIIF